MSNEPTAIDTAIQQGFDLFSNGKRQQGIDLLTKLAIKYPRAANVQQAAGMVHFQDGKTKEAEIYFKRSLEMEPSNPIHLHSYGTLLAKNGQWEEAGGYVASAIKLYNQSADFWSTYSKILQNTGHYEGAVETMNNALDLDPKNPVYALDMYNLMSISEPAAAFDDLKSACYRYLDNYDLMRVVCAEANYQEHLSEKQVLQLHRDFGKKLISSLKPQAAFSNDRNPHRALKIGVVGSDMRLHSVSFFLLPLLRGLTKLGHSIYCYNVLGGTDSVTKIYEKEFVFRHRNSANAVELGRRIFEDRVDVLIDINGYTHGGDPMTILVRPAPVIVSAIGYPQTTGAEGYQYRLGDHDVDPPEADEVFAEKLLRLDRPFLCYQPLFELPEIESRENTGPVVFGSFNATVKIQEGTMERWAKILNAVPESRLVLKALSLENPLVVARINGLAEKFGIGDRVEILKPEKDSTSHMALYGKMDIGLDPLVYNGTTTTVEAMLMGVPVICEWGNVHRSRTSAMLVKAVGHPEWAAQSEGELIEIAKDLAANIDQVRQGRKALREAVLSSALCDQVGYAQAVDAQIRKAWQAYCAE